jgi:hypothetical protein
MKNQIYRGAGAQLTLLVLLMAGVRVNCRQWQTIVDHDIVRKSNTDTDRYSLKLEADPFFFPGDGGAANVPSEAPKADSWTTFGPTSATSWSGTYWTSTSSSSVEDSGGSGGEEESSAEESFACESGLKHYEVHMMDSWGDGWPETAITITGISDQNPSTAANPTTTTNTNTQGDTTLSISETINFDSISSAGETNPLGQIFQGSLQEGNHDSADICLLPNRCYQLVASGGEFSDEVSWEVRSADSMVPILSGGASAECTFSLPDENGVHFCQNKCNEQVHEQEHEPPQDEEVTSQIHSLSNAVARSSADTLSSMFESAEGTR